MMYLLPSQDHGNEIDIVLGEIVCSKDKRPILWILVYFSRLPLGNKIALLIFISCLDATATRPGGVANVVP